tara:strand:+ start:21547 stop:21957 length:411 start_codon:yes stop_codon:yes gene_type:complete
MKKAEILEILEKIESMKTIGKVKIKSDDFELVVKKDKPQTQIISREVNSKSALPSKKPNDGMASAFQVKYARDLIGKVFGEDDRQSFDFLAHTLEIPMAEVPDIGTWDETLTVDMVSAIIDGLQPMYKKSTKRSDF